MHIEPLTYYDLLEVSETATASEVRKAYLKKAAECHPDKHVGTSEEDRATEAFKAINEAYETLFDADLREEYDQKLATLRLANRSPSPEPRPVPTYVSPPFFPFPPMQPMPPVGLHPPPLHPHPGAGAGAGVGAGRGRPRFPAPLFHPFFTPPTDPAFRPFLRRERVFRPRPMRSSTLKSTLKQGKCSAVIGR
ncbi:hypothetical protein EHS25_009368 [Saitozyma podzolica]|uniref:J domain-containing protein n=1 Tax=Saitozyma podzolica TaxID=1890683 RepID=A0A427YLR4_9TREE|nr:hypothetical protein EHS25_009368 [Saitozyma podzolica]